MLFRSRGRTPPSLPPPSPREDSFLPPSLSLSASRSPGNEKGEGGVFIVRGAEERAGDLIASCEFVVASCEFVALRPCCNSTPTAAPICRFVAIGEFAAICEFEFVGICGFVATRTGGSVAVMNGESGAILIARVWCGSCSCCSALQCVAVCCSVLQCVAVCCSVLQCVAVCVRFWAYQYSLCCRLLRSGSLQCVAV